MVSSNNLEAGQLHLLSKDKRPSCNLVTAYFDLERASSVLCWDKSGGSWVKSHFTFNLDCISIMTDSLTLEQKELRLVDNVEFKILGVANREDKLQWLLQRYLAPLLLKAGSEHLAVRNKVCQFKYYRSETIPESYHEKGSNADVLTRSSESMDGCRRLFSRLGRC